MINYIKGTITQLSNPFITVMLNNISLGFNIAIPDSYFARISINQETNLHLHLHWNQENGPTLYGFLPEIEKKVFELVISCTGIGPKIGLSLVSNMSPQEFIRAINSLDIKSLSTVNGIGTKKAEQIILQLKNKIKNLTDSNLIDGNIKHIKGINEVLCSLNYSRNEITEANNYLIKNFSENDYTFDQLLKQALSFLSKRI